MDTKNMRQPIENFVEFFLEICLSAREIKEHNLYALLTLHSYCSISNMATYKISFAIPSNFFSQKIDYVFKIKKCTYLRYLKKCQLFGILLFYLRWNYPQARSFSLLEELKSSSLVHTHLTRVSRVCYVRLVSLLVYFICNAANAP